MPPTIYLPAGSGAHNRNGIPPSSVRARSLRDPSGGIEGAGKSGLSQSRVSSGSESAGFEQRACDVVRQVPESEGAAAEVFDPAVDGLGGAVRRAGPVEEREDVCGALLEGPAELADLGQRGRDAAGDGVDHGLHHGLAMLLVGFAVGGDHALVDAPGRLDLDVLRDREQGFETGLLLLGEQRGAVWRVRRAA